MCTQSWVPPGSYHGNCHVGAEASLSGAQGCSTGASKSGAQSSHEWHSWAPQSFHEWHSWVPQGVHE